MIGLHEIVEHVEIVRPIAVKKNPVALPKLRFETYNEGKAAQIMHIGPFSEEGLTIKKIHSFIKKNGYLGHFGTDSWTNGAF